MLIDELIKKQTFTRHVPFKGLEGDYFICDIEWEKASKVKKWEEVNGKMKLKSVTHHPIDKDVRLKLDTTNSKLLEKIDTFAKGEVVRISYRVYGRREYEIDTWEIIDVLDEIDLAELSNQNCLITTDVEVVRKRVEEKRAKDKTKAKPIKSKKKNKNYVICSPSFDIKVISKTSNEEEIAQIRKEYETKGYKIIEIPEVKGSSNIFYFTDGSDE